VISGTAVVLKVGGEQRERSRLKRLLPNVIQPSEGHCINKEGRRRSGKAEKVEDIAVGLFHL